MNLGNVLVVDDDPIFCEIVKTYLIQSGAAGVSVTLNGHHALEVLGNHENRIELIVLDLNMPEIDGIGLLKMFKNQSYSGAIAIVSSETPVVIDMAQSLAELHGLNVIDTAKKPITKDTVDRWHVLLNP